MINYRKTIQGVQRMIQDGRVEELVRLVQNFQQGLAMIQFAVAEIEIEAGFTPTTTVETLLVVRQILCAQGTKRMLKMDELNTVWYVDRVWQQSYEERSPLEIAVQAVLGNTIAA
jgi:hypothetical protein